MIAAALQADGMSVPGVITVLVVDDDARVLAAIAETAALEDDLAVVATAADAASARSSAAQLRPSVALVDVLLPDEATGLTLVRTLVGYGYGYGCRVVAMRVQSGQRDAALASGATAFVEKGGDIDSLLLALRGLTS